jgi:hypothetical protein
MVIFIYIASVAHSLYNGKKHERLPVLPALPAGMHTPTVSHNQSVCVCAKLKVIGIHAGKTGKTGKRPRLFLLYSECATVTTI